MVRLLHPFTLNTSRVSLTIRVLLILNDDIGDIATIRSRTATLAVGAGVSKVPLAKVSKGLSATAELDDPFCILETKSLLHVVVRRSDVGASGQVLERRGARGGGRGIDTHADLVACTNGKLISIIDRRLGPPLIPGLYNTIAPGDNTSLQDSAVTLVA